MREPGREVIDVHAGRYPRLHVREPVREREREFLQRGGPGLPDVIAADGDGVPLRHVLGTVGHDVGDDAHRGLRWEDPRLLGDVLLQKVVLESPPERLGRHALLLAHADVHREQHRRRSVDGHRRADLVERDAVEQGLHVPERVDGHAAHSDFALGALVVRVVPHDGREVERYRQTRLTMVKQEFVAPIRILRRAESGKLPHRPQTPAVHVVPNAARVGKLARETEVAFVVQIGDVLGRVEEVHLLARDGGEESVALPGGRGHLLVPGPPGIQRLRALLLCISHHCLR